MDPSEAIKPLAQIVGPQHVLTGQAVHERSAGIWGESRTIAADLLVRPANTDELSAVLRYCDRVHHKVIVHGGLTGVVDGAWAEPGDLVISLERMNAIEWVDPVSGVLQVQAGTTLAAVQEAAAEHGLMFPLDIGARGTATIGGNVATNAGGNRVIRYGMTRQLVLGLEAVLADGTVLTNLNQMVKNNAGYDLKQLFIGTEGTLGIVTRVVLRLVPQPQTSATALLAINGYERVCRLLGHLNQACGGTLSAYEVMWNDFYRLMSAQRHQPLLPDYDYYVLVESLGSDPVNDEERFIGILAKAQQQGLLDDCVIAKSVQEQQQIWTLRDDVVRLLDIKPMFLFDVSLPIRDVERYLTDIRQQVSAKWPECRLFAFGHLGDGNIHLAISAGTAAGEARAAVEEQVYRPLGALGGSVSAEHGIGLEKKPYLSWCRSEDEIRIMRQLKKMLDPHGILNPRIIFE